VSADDSGEIRLWNAHSGNSLLTLHEPDGLQVRSVAFSPNGKTIAAARADGTVLFWETDPPAEGYALRRKAQVAARLASEHIKDNEFSPNDVTVIRKQPFLDSEAKQLAIHIAENRIAAIKAINAFQSAAESERVAQLRKAFESDHRDALLAKWRIRFYEYEVRDESGCPANWTSLVEHPPITEETVDEIDFVWGAASPAAGVPDDYFAAVATTQVVLGAGLYELKALSDDGVRVWVDERLAIDNWSGHADAVDIATVTLEAGTHAIRIEYFDMAFGATLRFRMVKVD
jgi:hypothetical protein